MSPSCNDVSGKELQPRRQRRTHVPDKPNYSLNLWSIMKNCIGKELSKIPMPVSGWALDLHLSDRVRHTQINFNLSQFSHPGKLQRASVDAAASHRGPGVSWALGQGSTLRLLPGADVPGCCFLCLIILHHSPSDGKTLQPPPGWDLRARSPGGIWLPLTVWAGNSTATESFCLLTFAFAAYMDTCPIFYFTYISTSTSKVSHHPPAAAHHVISQRGWTLWQEITIASKFRGKYLSIMPLGETFHIPWGRKQTIDVNKGSIIQI